MIKKGLLTALFIISLSVTVYAAQNENAHTLERFFFNVNNVFENIINGNFSADSFHIDNFQIENIINLYNSAPGYVWTFIASVVKITLCFIVLSFKKSFFEQCGAVIVLSPIEAVKFGASIYFILAALSIIFLLSAVGFIMSVVFVSLLYIISVAGEVSVSIALGCYISDKLQIRLDSNIYLFLLYGILPLEIINNIPYAGRVTGLLILPILSAGVIAKGVINGYVDKKFYNFPADKSDDSGKMNIDAIRNIIIRSEGKQG